MVEEWEPGRFPAANRDGFYLLARIKLRPREESCFGQVFVSGPFRAMWDYPSQRLKWPQTFDQALPDLALLGMGEHLDDNEIPPLPTDDHYALQIAVTSDLFDIFKRPSSSDQLVQRYVAGRIYWTWRYKVEPTVFLPWEAHRFGVDATDFGQAAFRHVGRYWQADRDAFYALPEFINQFESQLNNHAASPGVQPTKYEVALSFAGEQRPYVEKVAAVLKSAGVSLFYDDYADLWGKDLTLEIQRVYRSGARYVVVFVSREYVAKAWPNLERQHALAGRMERMDDSILPARFDPIDLPGLPTTVGYVDISHREPQELADLILTKLRGQSA